ncbi:MAG: hypothetical protein IH987_12560 [Planctomycetes bacterium]|nr:hypothetical protein [Planctomycetota bacterium]
MNAVTVIAQYEGLNASGWTLMLLCIGMVTVLTVFCYYRILREPRPSEHHHAPLDIDTRDTEP